MEEVEYLHESLLSQLKESATKAYNNFFHAFELLNSNKNKSKEIFLNILKDGDFLLSSLEFYNDKFKGIDRSEDYLYIGQILSLQFKACHDLAVIFKSEKNDIQMNRYESKKDSYRNMLYSYYLLSKGNSKINKILETFLREIDILNSKAVK